jgi:hypothetical protein
MTPLELKLTARPDVAVLGCPRCDTAMLPRGEWPKGGPAAVRCPLCGLEQPVDIVEVGSDDAFAYNVEQHRQDADETPIYSIATLSYDEDMLIIDIPELLDDPAFFALQDGVAPVASFGWVGGTGLLGANGYRLFLVVRVTDLSDENLFRLEFPLERIPELGRLTEDHTVVLVSQRKGVFFPEAGDVYLQAVREAGGQPGEPVTINSWVQLEDTE